MSQGKALYQWTAMVAKHLETLSQPQVKVLAAFSLGLGLSQRCALSWVAEKLSVLGKVESVERGLRRSIGNPKLALAGCCPMLVRWGLSSLKRQGPLVLLVDETSLQEHLKVMVVAVAYQGKAIPLAWRRYRQEAWPLGRVELIESLLQWVPQGVAQGNRVVEADWGIGNSPQLLAAIEAMGWRYLARVSKGVHLVSEEGRETRYGNLVSQVAQPGVGKSRPSRRRAGDGAGPWPNGTKATRNRGSC